MFRCTRSFYPGRKMQVKSTSPSVGSEYFLGRLRLQDPTRNSVCIPFYFLFCNCKFTFILYTISINKIVLWNSCFTVISKQINNKRVIIHSLVGKSGLCVVSRFGLPNFINFSRLLFALILFYYFFYFFIFFICFLKLEKSKK